MVGGISAHSSSLCRRPNHRQSQAVAASLQPAWQRKQHSSRRSYLAPSSSNSSRPLLKPLRVAQQFGSETLTSSTASAATATAPAADPQQQLLEEEQLRAAVEQEVPVEVPPDVLTEFEHELEEDLASVAVTLTAVTGVIIFWRGVWSLLDCELLPPPQSASARQQPQAAVARRDLAASSQLQTTIAHTTSPFISPQPTDQMPLPAPAACVYS